jgi:RNA polymerase sigma factor (sigma-70 family)
LVSLDSQIFHEPLESCAGGNTLSATILVARPPLKLVTSRPLSDRSLGEREVFDLVYVRMRALAGVRAPDLDDLVQLAAEQVFRNMRSFRGDSQLSTWIYGVCYRVLLMQRRWYRRWKLRFSFWEESELPSGTEASPAQIVEQRVRAERLHSALRQLSEKYRAVVVLHDLEELDVREIAAVVGANELTVRSRLRDGRKQLFKLLDGSELSEGAP